MAINKYKCQIYSVANMPEALSLKEVIWQRKNWIKRVFKRRLFYLQNLYSEKTKNEDIKGVAVDISKKVKILKPGDVVRVRSEKEISATLDKWNMLKRCGFMQEMKKYCGTKQKVFKRIEKFLDERDYLMKKCSGIVILEDVFCEGTDDFGSCDRTCFFFWREEWLEKIEKA